MKIWQKLTQQLKTHNHIVMKSQKSKQRLIDEMIEQMNSRENDFPVVSDLSKLPDRYRGMAMEVNDHGNITVWKCFLNGNVREIASRV